MGEIVDLEIYRKRLRHKASRPRGTGNRRDPEVTAPRPEKPGPGGAAREPRIGETGRGPSGNAKIETSDPESE